MSEAINETGFGEWRECPFCKAGCEYGQSRAVLFVCPECSETCYMIEALPRTPTNTPPAQSPQKGEKRADGTEPKAGGGSVETAALVRDPAYRYAFLIRDEHNFLCYESEDSGGLFTPIVVDAAKGPWPKVIRKRRNGGDEVEWEEFDL